MKPRWEQDRFERAVSIAQAFERVQREIWPSLWPHGCCFVSSLMLAPLIRVPLEWDVRIAIGSVHSKHPHAWIETTDGDIIDPTYGMFDGGSAFRSLRSAGCGRLGHVRRLLLSVEEERRYRDAIRPSAPSGYDESANIMSLFGSNPFVNLPLIEP